MIFGKTIICMRKMCAPDAAEACRSQLLYRRSTETHDDALMEAVEPWLVAAGAGSGKRGYGLVVLQWTSGAAEADDAQ